MNLELAFPVTCHLSPVTISICPQRPVARIEALSPVGGTCGRDEFAFTRLGFPYPLRCPSRPERGLRGSGILLSVRWVEFLSPVTKQEPHCIDANRVAKRSA